MLFTLAQGVKESLDSARPYHWQSIRVYTLLVAYVSIVYIRMFSNVRSSVYIRVRVFLLYIQRSGATSAFGFFGSVF